MQPFPVPVLPATHPRIRPRTALVASADRSFRQRLRTCSPACAGRCARPKAAPRPGLRPKLRHPEAVIVDSWLPDLDLSEFLSDFRGCFPEVDLVTAAGSMRRRESARALSAGTCSTRCAAARKPTPRRGTRLRR